MYTSSKSIYKQASTTFGWACLLLLSLSACVDDAAVAPDTSYEFQIPSNFPKPTYTFEKNPITKEGFELGKALFYDPILSRDGSVSCNNCHIQSTAFADSPIHPVSIGVDNRMGIRNAPSLTNMAFFPEFFWDGGVTHLDFVAINAIESPVEMDESVVRMVEKLNASEKYRDLFQKAFGIEEVTLPYTLYGLSQFINRMVSANSRYDWYVRGEQGGELSQLEQEGMLFFEQKCASCHSGALFTDFSYRNNGISTEFTDTGRQRITSLESDKGKFRVPSLRNVGITAPYMHNAKFNTLEEVMQHYSEGMRESATVDPQFRQGEQLIGIPMSPSEQTAIIAFLKTLTDTEFVKDPIFFNN